MAKRKVKKTRKDKVKEVSDLYGKIPKKKQRKYFVGTKTRAVVREQAAVSVGGKGKTKEARIKRDKANVRKKLGV